jgi:hypothetical protein
LKHAKELKPEEKREPKMKNQTLIKLPAAFSIAGFDLDFVRVFYFMEVMNGNLGKKIIGMQGYNVEKTLHKTE